MLSVHDCRIQSYRVSAVDQEIILDLEAETGGERAAVVFRGVIGYRLLGDNFKTSLFDITEVPAKTVVAENRALFAEGSRCAWPGTWNVPGRDPADHVREAGVHGFVIQSSLGMEGWILAKSMEIQNGAAR